VHFIPHATPVPQPTTADAILKAAAELTTALQQPQMTITPNDPTRNALAKLAEIFQQVAANNKATAKPTEQPTNQSPAISPPRASPSPVTPPSVATPQAPMPLAATPPVPEPRVPDKDQTHTNESPLTIKANNQKTPAQRNHLRATLQEKLTDLQQARRTAKSYHPADLYRPYNRHSTRHRKMTNTPVLQAIIYTTTGRIMEYRHLIHPSSPVRNLWLRSMGTEIGRLAQGLPANVEHGTNTIRFIKQSQVPKDKIVTYARILADIRPQKEDPNQIRLTVGGNLLQYDHDTGTPSSDLTTTKLFLNSVVSTEGARFIVLDVKDFYLNTPMASFEYMKILLRLLPENVIEHYKLRELAEGSEYAYMEI